MQSCYMLEFNHQAEAMAAMAAMVSEVQASQVWSHPVSWRFLPTQGISGTVGTGQSRRASRKFNTHVTPPIIINNCRFHFTILLNKIHWTIGFNMFQYPMP